MPLALDDFDSNYTGFVRYMCIHLARAPYLGQHIWGGLHLKRGGRRGPPAIGRLAYRGDTVPGLTAFIASSRIEKWRPWCCGGAYGARGKPLSRCALRVNSTFVKRKSKLAIPPSAAAAFPA